MRPFYVCVVLILCTMYTQAQDTTKTTFEHTNNVFRLRTCIPYVKQEIGIKPQLGFLMAHHTQMQYMIQGHVRAIELYAEHTGAVKSWHFAYRFPTIGISGYFGDLGNKVNMGYAISVFPYVKFHLIKRKLFQFNSRVGAGMAYLTKSFDRIDNNKNSAIAAPFNATLSFSLEPEWTFKKLDIGLDISFIHFSNGAFKTPNLGFNIPSLSLNLGYSFNNREIAERKTEVMRMFTKNSSIEFMGLVGAKEIMPSNGPKYFVGNLQVQFKRHYQFKSNLLVFTDLNYNEGYHTSYEHWYKKTVAKSKAIRAGIGIGYGLALDRLVLFVHNGFYVVDGLHYDGFMYQRLGVRYTFDNNLVVNLSLKTHYAKADVIEAGLGYCLRLKTKKPKA